MTGPTGESLMSMRLRIEQDIFAVRQLGREVARAVGLETQDQTRFATAISEVGRVLLAEGPDTEVVFSVRAYGVPTLHVTMAQPVSGEAGQVAGQLHQVGRLVDTMEVDDGDIGTVVRMARRLRPALLD